MSQHSGRGFWGPNQTRPNPRGLGGFRRPGGRYPQQHGRGGLPVAPGAVASGSGTDLQGGFRGGHRGTAWGRGQGRGWGRGHEHAHGQFQPQQQQQEQQIAGTKRGRDEDDHAGGQERDLVGDGQVDKKKKSWHESVPLPTARFEEHVGVDDATADGRISAVEKAVIEAGNLSKSGRVYWTVRPLEAIMTSSAIGPAVPVNEPVPESGSSELRAPVAYLGYTPPARSAPPPPLPPPTVRRCGNCGKGGHDTRNCAQPKFHERDTPVDPFCNRVWSEGHWLAHGRTGHQVPGGCPELVSLTVAQDIDQLFRVFVLERRRRPALRVKGKELCFVAITLRYSDSREGGRMSRAMEGMWPYTKNDAVRHFKALKQFFLRGMLAMPAGELESRPFEEIREAYDEGRLHPQILSTVPTEETRLGDVSSIAAFPNV